MKKKCFLSIILLSIFVISYTVKAYYIQNSGSYTSRIRVNAKIASNSKYETPYRNAQASWNSAYSKINWGNDNSSVSNVVVSNYPDSWFGRYSPGPIITSNKRVSIFNIYINDRTIPASYAFRQSVIAHEMGHALNLGHTNNAYTLMSHSRNRYIVYKPTSDEINGVEKVYP
ncbi:matrixin family metalloprotease [Miniphocaeibacter massiliensis]|uniref:matrixin family metalloprotease n=1 Tax=Miniphocaeibacter massiliensis TaxID=2041841 RepID=UPI000C070F9A|nr:matrixin family metalloprotease [Miniphocaeibacter massiliensis]